MEATVTSSTRVADIPERGEVLLVTSAIVSLLCCAIYWSFHKVAWADEVFTWNELSDPSLGHMLHGILRGADGGMPVFYITGWLWVKVFGNSDLALRLYSACGFCAALVVVWRTLRRYYSVWPTAFGVLLTWCTSLVLLLQCAEARFYGLYQLVAAVVVSVSARIADEQAPRRRLLLVGFIFHAILVLTHLLALMYAVLIVAAIAICDRLWNRPFRWKVYASQAAGWLALLIWLPGIRATAAVAKPHGWNLPPQFVDLIDCYILGMFGSIVWLIGKLFTHAPIELFIICGTAMPLVFVLRARQRNSVSTVSKEKALHRREPLTMIGSFLLFAPLILYIYSRVATPIYVMRYVLPTLIGYAVLLTRFASRWLTPFATHKWIYSTFLFTVLVIPLASFRVVRHALYDADNLEISTVQAIPAENDDIVIGDAMDFWPLMRYSTPTQQRRYVYLLDWDAALKERRAAVGLYHLMFAQRNTGYFPGRILFTEEFLCTHQKFLLLDAPTEGQFDVIFRTDPHYHWTVVQVLDPQRYLYEVTRTSPPATCSPH